MSMNTELKQLDELLQTKRPEYYEMLNEPLSIEEISSLEAMYAIQIPTELKTLYLWKNGQSLDEFISLVNGSRFYPLEMVLNKNKELTAMIGNEIYIENYWNPSWLPLFIDGGGSSICLDVSGIFTGDKGQIIKFWNGYNDRHVIAPSLTDFLKSLNQYYSETAIDQFDQYFDITDRISKWKKEFIVDDLIE